jgi:PIN like domain
MRKAFHQYFRPDEETLKSLWQKGLFSFDASVLLNLYGYSKKTRDELVSIFEEKANRVRLPHQFGLEYARNRTTVILKQVHNCLRVEDSLKKTQKEIEAKRDHPFLTKKSARAYQAILSELEESRKAMEKLVGNDPYAEKLFKVFEGRVGKTPTKEELAQLEKEAEQRFANQIPPGFADVKEKGKAAAGDYIGWKQLMEISKAESKGIILVTDDVKEDWWLVERERYLGPLPRLLEEFFEVTQQPFYMYTSESFLRYAKEYTEAEIGDEVIEEVSQRLHSQRVSLRDAIKALEGLDLKPLVELDWDLLGKQFAPKTTAPPEEIAPEPKGQSVQDSPPDASKAGQEIKTKRGPSDGS